MAKKSLLEIVQDILSDMVSDEVNSIDDTVESQSVAQIVRSTYEGMMANRNWPHTRKLVNLEASADTAKPTHMRMPDRLKELSEIRYDSRKNPSDNYEYKIVRYRHPDEFLRYIANRKSNDTTTTVVTDYDGVKLLIANNKAPDYYTSFDDVHIVFDSFDSNVDDTLKSSKTSCLAYIVPVWTHEDSFIPDLPAEAFPALISEAKSSAFYSIKQMINEKEEMKSARQNRWLARKAWRAHGGVRYADFGRKSRK